MFKMNGSEIKDMIYGATLFGGGGGGACESGLTALQQYMDDHGITDEADVMVRVMDVDEMDPNGYAACTAAMGAPTKFKEVRIAPYINGAFDHLCSIAEQMRREIMYSISVEIGGFNTLVPLLVAMEKGIPFIDADGAGRAVPTLDTLLLHINGLATSPLAMADNKGNKVSIKLNNAVDAQMGEIVGRNLCVAFGQMGGLSGWMVKQNEIKQNLPLGSVRMCQKVGHIMRNTESSVGLFEKLESEAGLTCMELDRGQVVDVHNEQASGFDKGYVEIQGSKGIWKTYFLNENLVIQKDGVTVMTVPDIICTCNAETGEPLSNADIIGKNDEILIKNIVLGAIKVNERWWNNSLDCLQKIWSYYFGILGFPTQQIKKYPPIF
jgi:DUF917 family protein